MSAVRERLRARDIDTACVDREGAARLQTILGRGAVRPGGLDADGSPQACRPRSSSRCTARRSTARSAPQRLRGSETRGSLPPSLAVPITTRTSGGSCWWVRLDGRARVLGARGRTKLALPAAQRQVRADPAPERRPARTCRRDPERARLGSGAGPRPTGTTPRPPGPLYSALPNEGSSRRSGTGRMVRW